MPLEHPSIWKTVQRIRVFYPAALDGGQARTAIEKLGNLADQFGCLIYWENDASSDTHQHQREVIERGFLGMAQKKQVVEERELSILYISGVLQGNLPGEKMLRLIEVAEGLGFYCEELAEIKGPAFTSRMSYTRTK
jgi:hypothetical protein